MNDIYDSSSTFIDEEEFIDCFERGCESQFDYDGKSYSCCFVEDRAFHILEVGNRDTRAIYETPEALLDHPIGDKRLRDILQDMIVTDRTVFPMED